MKRTFALFLALFMIFGIMAGCGSSSNSASPAPSAAQASAPQSSAPQSSAPQASASQPSGEQKPNEVYEFSISHHDPESSATGTFLENWASAVEEASNGAIQIDIFHGGVLGGPTETINLITNNTASMGAGAQCAYPGQFPLTEVVSLPMIGMTSAQQASRVMYDLYESSEDLQAEYSAFKVLLVYANCTSPISFSRKEIGSKADMAGLNIRANAGPPTGFIEALGASPVNVAMGELYQALENNTVDGVLTDWHGMYSFKLYEAVNYILDVPVYTNTFFFLMNWDAYNSLPDDLKAVIDDYSGWEALDIIGTTWDDYEAMCREAISSETDSKLITLNDEEYALFKQAADQVRTD